MHRSNATEMFQSGIFRISWVLQPQCTIFRKFWEHFRKMSGTFWMFPVFQFSWHLPAVFLKCSQNFLKMVHCGQNTQDIPNIPLWNILIALFPCVLSFTGLVNWGYFAGDITKNTLNEPPRNIVGTFFGYILNFPTYFLIRKPPGYTVNVPSISWAGEIPVKLAQKILNVLKIFWVGIG